MKHFRLNQKVRVSSENDNNNYDSFRNDVLVIINVARDKSEHPGYDERISPEYLYDLKKESGENIPFLLYDYELEPA